MAKTRTLEAKQWSTEDLKQLEDMGEALGKRVRDGRVMRGWSQQELAFLLGDGCTQQDISKFEAGDLSIPAEFLFKLAEIGIDLGNVLQQGLFPGDPLTRITNLWDSGMMGVYPNRRDGLKALLPYIQHERSGIHIVGSSLKGLILDRPFFDAIGRRIMRVTGLDVRVIIGHPAMAGLRAWVEGRNSALIKNEIDEANAKLKTLSPLGQDNIKVRVALHPPTIFCIFLMSQRRALINPYTQTIEAYNSPSFLLSGASKTEYLFSQYHEHHFTAAWDCELQSDITISIDDSRMDPSQNEKATAAFDKALELVTRKSPDKIKPEC